MSEYSDYEESIIIMTLGNSEVGKTSFILRFVENRLIHWESFWKRKTDKAKSLIKIFMKELKIWIAY